MKATEEQLYRALCISNLTAVYQKKEIGRLSAYCGAVSAGAGAAELLAMSDKIMVMSDGQKSGFLNKDEATQELVVQYAIGG